ncbi:Sodium/potassium-transporting_ATPase alpha chain [Hexamita inflata]|uniref:Sodium/potassium-transporting ATPase alpha chain n=1 Tax=Hexamita inflata TaxID=28002 RepID=A0AA86RHA8_9EUKA|nr:Sodium/potassium-transporting ATPase alpha chain [Hexamita inflata]
MLAVVAQAVFKVCQKYQSGDIIKDIDQDFIQQFQNSYERVAGLGERVIGLAYAFSHVQDKYETPDEIITPMIFLGFVSLVDPPKDGVVEAVAQCIQSVQVTMVTGDHYYIDPTKIDFDGNQQYFMDENIANSQCCSCTNTAQHAKSMRRLSSLPSQFIPRRPNTGAVMTGDFVQYCFDHVYDHCFPRIQKVLYYQYISHKLSWLCFVNFHHGDFPTVTLLNLIQQVWNSVEKLPKGVTNALDLSNYIFCMGQTARWRPKLFTLQLEECELIL